MCEQASTLTIEHFFSSQAESLKIKLMKISKGYQWEISCAGSDMSEILSRFLTADTALKSEYESA